MTEKELTTKSEI